MVRYYLDEYQTQLFHLPHLARMIRMIEIQEDDAMTVGTEMVIDEITGAVEVVVVVDKSSSTRTKVRLVSPALSLT
jgi:hypothetical protein